MHPRTTFSFYQTILAIGYHPVDINKDVIKLLFTVRDCDPLVSDMGGGDRIKKSGENLKQLQAHEILTF